LRPRRILLQKVCRRKSETWDNADVTRSRRLRVITAVCLAAFIFAAVLPAAAFGAVLVPLPEIFGTVISVRVAAFESVSPQPFPPRSPLSSRAPPA